MTVCRKRQLKIHWVVITLIMPSAVRCSVHVVQTAEQERREREGVDRQAHQSPHHNITLGSNNNPSFTTLKGSQFLGESTVRPHSTQDTCIHSSKEKQNVSRFTNRNKAQASNSDVCITHQQRRNQMKNLLHTSPLSASVLLVKSILEFVICDSMKKIWLQLQINFTAAIQLPASSTAQSIRIHTQTVELLG